LSSQRDSLLHPTQRGHKMTLHLLSRPGRTTAVEAHSPKYSSGQAPSTCCWQSLRGDASSTPWQITARHKVVPLGRTESPATMSLPTSASAATRRPTIAKLILIEGAGWLGSRVVSVLDSGAEGPGFKSQPRRCRVTVLGRAYSKRVFRTNCALRIKKCALRISSGISFLSTS